MKPLQLLQLIACLVLHEVAFDVSRDDGEHGVDESETVSVNPP
jgi:hypothetical protein